MENKLKVYGIIPARYASSRFSGKPLADILGKPMFWHVFHRASLCRDLLKVVLATDDERIFSVAKDFGVPVVMTRNDHKSGTDRVMEAAQLIKVSEDAVVINIQGDEPALAPEMLTELITPFSDSQVQVTTLAKKIESHAAKNPDLVKVVLTANSNALYFSRSDIPYKRDESGEGSLGHVGLYAFRMKTLKRFVSLPMGKLEKTERLEQLRLLENNIPVHVVITRFSSLGVDRPEDIKEAERIIRIEG